MRYLNVNFEAACPLCQHTKNKLLYKVTSTEAARHFLVTCGLEPGMLQAVADKIQQLWKGETAAIVACRNCGFIFADPFVAGDYEFYNLLPHSKAEGPENWKWEFEKTYKKIAELAKDNKDLALFEIGANTGDFVKRISNIVPKEKIYCTEYSEIGIGSLKKAGIDAESRDFREVSRDTGFHKKFDIICIFQVLEHLNDLEGVFGAFDVLSKPRGHLFIGVPNGAKIKFNERNNALLDMPPNHIGRYNRGTFEYLGKKYGWKIEEIVSEPHTSLDVMKTVLYYQSLKRAQFPPVNETSRYRISRYIEIKRIRLQAVFMQKRLGETLWVHYRKADQ
jgi:SAM-dependent methyltransferase